MPVVIDSRCVKIATGGDDIDTAGGDDIDTSGGDAIIANLLSVPLFQDDRFMKRWTLLKNAAQRLSTSSSINQQKQAMCAIFRLATGSNTFGLQALKIKSASADNQTPASIHFGWFLCFFLLNAQ